ncbi:MAG: hypothetical protein DRJ37_04185 [Thermoprotei archaeon]|nr:MAG: hypothetical protein DRJ37_04185 [Thermoprotei archaeon]
MVDILTSITEAITGIITQIIEAIPSIFAALIVIGIGYVIGGIVGKAVNKLIELLGIEKAFDQTDAGKAFRKAGIDLSNFVGSLVKAFVIVISVSIALQLLEIGEPTRSYILAIADYLPKLMGGIILLSLGFVLVEFLASYVRHILLPVFPEKHKELVDMLRNLLLIGLIAIVLSIALQMMLFTGEFVFSLIIGFVIIGVGISLGDTVVTSIVEDHEEFKPVAGYAKFILYSIFLLVGVAGIFSGFPGTEQVIANLAWGLAIAMGIMLVPIIYQLTKKMVAEAK